MQCRTCGKLDPDLVLGDCLPCVVADQAKEIGRLQAENRGLKASLDLARTQADGVWKWQGDGGDDPGSLACPVVMSADTLRGLLERINRILPSVEHLAFKMREVAAVRRSRSSMFSYRHVFETLESSSFLEVANDVLAILQGMRWTP